MKDKRLSGAEKNKERIRRKRRKERAKRRNAIRRCLEEVIACLKRKYAETGEKRDDGKRTEESKEEGEKSKELKRK